MAENTNGSDSSRGAGDGREIIPLAANAFASTATRDDDTPAPLGAGSGREIIPVAAAAFVGAFVGALVASQLV